MVAAVIVPTADPAKMAIGRTGALVEMDLAANVRPETCEAIDPIALHAATDQSANRARASSDQPVRWSNNGA